MQQIRCSLCGRQTLVDPQRPGTCPSCGFPLSVPADAAAPAPEMPETPVRVAETPLALGPIVQDPAPPVPGADPARPAPAGADLVLGPVVGDPAPVEVVAAVAAASELVAAPAAPIVPEATEAAPVEASAAAADAADTAAAGDVPAATDAAGGASVAEPVASPAASPVEAEAYVPPVPVTHSAWQDATDAPDPAIDLPVAAADDVYAGPALAAASDATEPDAVEAAATPEEPVETAVPVDATAVQAPAFDVSDAAIVAAGGPSAVVEDIYVTHLADSADEPTLPVTEAPVESGPFEPVATAYEGAEVASVPEPLPTAEPPAWSAASFETAPVEPAPVEPAPVTPAPAEVTPPVDAAPAEAIPSEAPEQTPPAAPLLAAAVVAPAEPLTQPAAMPPAPAPVAAHEPAAPTPPVAPYPQPAPYPGYGQPPSAPQYGALPGAQPAPPYPYPPQPPYPNPAQQPPAAAPYPYPAGAPLDQMGQMPPMGPIGPMSPVGPTPPKKSRVGLIVGVVVAAIVVLALVAAGIAALVLVRAPSSGSHAALVAATPTPAAQPTATSSIPSGFQPFSDSGSAFTMDVPSNWTQATPSNSTGRIVDFTAPDQTGRLRVAVISGALGNEGQAFDDGLLQAVVSGGSLSNKAGPTTVTQGGESWTQESADVTDSSGTLHVVAMVTTHGGNTFAVLYLGVSDSFSTLDTQDFEPMFASFRFQ